ncbi:CerR family C-terminal domain-containing protein [Sphingobium algorifonticola]|uniref:DUF1956 domain-containing protein n=1 Tax=Sphingobium algorifonticola TaxID=2008318 RepID=A0A437JD08_9SPHN|nr:CerR family C-terminal domain-containing protein [Sphingobium algorifonticola]RVT43808.1 DUF1956 domain-containing protein [Sphingobium algorifonticola]
MSISATPPVGKKPGPDGAGTRKRLVAAALDLFGRKGFDGVGAREIAAAAGAPLAAIPYHFGTKEALYRAALEQVRSRLGTAIAPAVEAARAGLDGTPEDARAALSRLQGNLLQIIAADPEAESWAKLLVREHLDPTDAFEIVYEDAVGNAIDLIAALLARSTGKKPSDPAILIEAFAKMGEVLIFRVTQHAIARRLGWSALGHEEAHQIAGALGWEK